jgi:hypothetical protein
VGCKRRYIGGWSWPRSLSGRAESARTGPECAAPSLHRLAQPEPDVAQIPAPHLRRLDPPDDPLTPEARVVDDHHDRLDALGRAPGGAAAATHQLAKLGSQIGMQSIEEPRDDVAAFVWREADTVVAADPDVHPPADERPVAVCAAPRVAVLRSGLIWVRVGVRAGHTVVWVNAVISPQPWTL